MNLEARDLYRFYRSGEEETLALQGATLSVGEGQVVVVRGPSGSGKSTLLNCLAGLDEPTGGAVRILGKPFTTLDEAARARVRASHIGVINQSGNLFGHMTVMQNIRFAQHLGRTGRSGDEGGRLLTRMRIQHRRNALPSQLSGGELARAALAVAMACSPELIIADEPTAELDTVTERDALELLVQAAYRGAAVIIASHSAAVAASADAVFDLTDGRLERSDE